MAKKIIWNVGRICWYAVPCVVFAAIAIQLVALRHFDSLAATTAWYYDRHIDRIALTSIGVLTVTALACSYVRRPGGGR